MRKVMFILLAITTLSSCFKEEDPWAIGSQKNTQTIELGSDYGNQVFYNLSQAEIVSTNRLEIWDLGFYSQDDAFYIRLNGARQMSAYATGTSSFSSVTAIDGDWEPRFDNAIWVTEGLAIDIVLDGGIQNQMVNSEVYIIDRGYDGDGNNLGEPVKFQIKEIVDGGYKFQYANLDGSNQQTILLAKDPTLNFVAFSFDTPYQTPTVEPDRNTWDILFSRNTDTVFTTDLTDYIVGYAVTGAYLNTAFTQAYLEEDEPFETINSFHVDESKFSSNGNIIGHDWKYFTDVYNIYPNKVYIIKDRFGYIYKMRFLNFYNPDNGLKGYPEFEFQLL